MDNEEVTEHNQFEKLIQGMLDDEYGYCNDFIDANTVNGLKDNLLRLHASGDMQPAGFGNKQDFQKDRSIRGDKIKWIEEQSTNSFELLYLQKMAKFILHLNKTCFTSIKKFESHYATYAKHDFYKRHLDQFKSENGRKYSIVLYLNQDWKEEDGGLLSLYPKDKALINISPLGGRIVFFRSDKMEHEVHPSFTRERNSIATWLKN